MKKGGHRQQDEATRFIRPTMQVLDEKALIPTKNLITPPPNHFTHETKDLTPFYYQIEKKSAPPDGHLPSGTKVILIREEQVYSWIANPQGLYICVPVANLKPL